MGAKFDNQIKCFANSLQDDTKIVKFVHVLQKNRTAVPPTVITDSIKPCICIEALILL